MGQKKDTLLLTASVLGFIYWITIIFSEFGSIDPIEFFKEISSLVESGDKLALLGILIIVVLIASSVLNIIGWKKKYNILVKIAIVFYFLTLNTLSAMICTVGILWDSEDELNMQKKKETPLFIIAGALGILGVVFWFVVTPPLVAGAVGSGEYPYSTSVIGLSVIGFCYIISLLASFVISISISLSAKLRNNPKKALIAAIFYIVSLSIPSAILCFIGFVCLNRRIVRIKPVEAKQDG
jgi:uncharacterized membrane protein